VCDLHTTPCNLHYYLTLGIGTGAVTWVCIWCCRDTRLQTNPDTKQVDICILFSIHTDWEEDRAARTRWDREGRMVTTEQRSL